MLLAYVVIKHKVNKVYRQCATKICNLLSSLKQVDGCNPAVNKYGCCLYLFIVKYNNTFLADTYEFDIRLIARYE